MISNWDLHPQGCTLVPAAASDAAFLHDLFVAMEMAAMPSHLPALRQMLDMQYHAKAATYRETFPNAVDLIIVKDQIRVGRFMIDFSIRPVHMVDLAILPEWQGRGIGTAILRAVCDTARMHGAQVALSVIEGQPAQPLYARLGFEVTERRVPYVKMLWSGC